MEKNRWLRVGLAILVLFLVCVFLRLARSILVPFALALFFAFAVTPALDFLVSRKLPKTVALVLILLLSFSVLYLIGTVFYSGGKSLADELPSYTDMVKGLLARIDSIIANPRLKVGLTEWIQNFNVGQLGTVLLSALGPFISFMSDLFLVFLFMIFILAARGRLLDKFHTAFSPAQAAAVSRTAARIDREIQRYLAVKTLTNLAIGVLVAAILAVLGVRFAVLFGVLSLLFNYVPTLGAIVAVALPAVMTLILEGGVTFKVVLVLVLLAAVHLALHRLIERRLMTKEISLSPLLVLFSLFFGAWLWGIPGMILAVPLLTAARIVFQNVPSLDGLGRMMDR
ncbi:MAG TPA: AI-2E family transporter [Candidatus Bathyarchaeia archaeon]|nr:AI-2E family transporter [Candidatus Bathyarchaeia archaeon]